MSTSEEFVRDAVGLLIQTLKDSPDKVLQNERFRELREAINGALLKASEKRGHSTTFKDSLSGIPHLKPFVITSEKGKLYMHDVGEEDRKKWVLIGRFCGESFYSSGLSLEDGLDAVREMWDHLCGYDEEELGRRDRRIRRFLTDHIEESGEEESRA